MAKQDSRWQKIPVLVWVGMAAGGTLGAWLGDVFCIGYDFVNGPFGPQAGVDPQPAGWVGWWIAGGAAIGVTAGLLLSVPLMLIVRLAGGSRPVARTNQSH
ncbi:hypothetical protein [Zavarzinella formosa]|uniref:hypothetical protein n=1 Tax=Zavarzinella formosa TaxID=360055 RepID=UPI0002D4D23C|nr:hypothetical protein [Zavarzinella formosa]